MDDRRSGKGVEPAFLRSSTKCCHNTSPSSACSPCSTREHSHSMFLQVSETENVILGISFVVRHPHAQIIDLGWFLC